MAMSSPSHAHAHTHADEHTHTGEPEFADLLELDGEVLHSYWAAVLTWVRQATRAAPHRVLDLGAGTGTGTIGLAQRFGGAEVLAVDAADDMLHRIRVKSLELGLAERVHILCADLDADWPVTGQIDVTWASMSLHHLANPDRVLGDIFAATRPGGLLAVAEFSEQLRFLPDDLGLGRPGLETRCLAALAAEHAHALPDLGSDWPPRLTAAGFTLLGERNFPIELGPPLTDRATDYAEHWLRRQRSRLADRLAADDVGALAELLDGHGPGSLRQRADLQIRGCRTVILARRS